MDLFSFRCVITKSVCHAIAHWIGKRKKLKLSNILQVTGFNEVLYDIKIIRIWKSMTFFDLYLVTQKGNG